MVMLLAPTVANAEPSFGFGLTSGPALAHAIRRGSGPYAGPTLRFDARYLLTQRHQIGLRLTGRLFYGQGRGRHENAALGGLYRYGFLDDAAVVPFVGLSLGVGFWRGWVIAELELQTGMANVDAMVIGGLSIGLAY